MCMKFSKITENVFTLTALTFNKTFTEGKNQILRHCFLYEINGMSECAM